MHFKIYDQLDYISRYLTLDEGDLLMTGTPEGLGPVNEGERIEASMRYEGKLLAEIKDVIQREK
jgi:acylpyruvate hydrolase